MFIEVLNGRETVQFFMHGFVFCRSYFRIENTNNKQLTHK